MIPIPAGTQIWVVCGATDMRRGFDGLAMMVQDVLKRLLRAPVRVPRQAI
jgi:transposase